MHSLPIQSGSLDTLRRGTRSTFLVLCVGPLLLPALARSPSSYSNDILQREPTCCLTHYSIPGELHLSSHFFFFFLTTNNVAEGDGPNTAATFHFAPAANLGIFVCQLLCWFAFVAVRSSVHVIMINWHRLKPLLSRFALLLKPSQVTADVPKTGHHP